MLYAYDEAKANDPATFDASEGVLSGATEGRQALTWAGSTPGAPVGCFSDIHHRKPGLEDWWVRHVTLEEAISLGRARARRPSSVTWPVKRCMRSGGRGAMAVAALAISGHIRQWRLSSL
jgi:hypothetical protein